MNIIAYSFIMTLVIFGELWPVTAAISCLQQDNLDQKVVIIHDRHDALHQDEENPVALLTRDHQDELKDLINILSESDKTAFFIEFPDLTNNFKQTLDSTTIHVPIKDAINNTMHNKAIEYVSFDKRRENHFWSREILLQPEIVEQNIKDEYPLPKEFHGLSIASYLNTLNHDERESKSIQEHFNVSLQSTAARKLNLFNIAKNVIDKETKKIGMNNDTHFLALGLHLSRMSQGSKAMLDLFNAQTVYTDLFLWKSVLNNKKPIIVVHGGAYHTYHLAHALKTVGYKNFFSKQDLTGGLIAEELHKITWPKIPVSFVKPVLAFLKLKR